RTVMTRGGFENSIASIAATGGSTNGVLHLLALAHEAGVPLQIDDFDRISARTPLLADLKPGGRFVANDMHRAGGTRLLAARLLEAGSLHGSEPTVSARTLGEEARLAHETPGQEVIRPLSNPLKSAGALLTDGRFSGATRGLMAGHVAPEAARGGPIAAVREGDSISFDVEARRLDLEVEDAVVRDRLKTWKPPVPRYQNGVFAKYARLVSSASQGAVT